MNRRAFLSWGTAGMAALCSAVGVSMAAVGRFMVPSVFYEPPQSFKIGNPADFPFGPPTFHGRRKDLRVSRSRQRVLLWPVRFVRIWAARLLTSAATRSSIVHAMAACLAPMATVMHGPAPRPLQLV